MNECNNQVTVSFSLQIHQYHMATGIYMQLPMVKVNRETPQLGPACTCLGLMGYFLFFFLWAIF